MKLAVSAVTIFCLLVPATPAATISPQGVAKDSANIAAAIQQAPRGETVRLAAGTFELSEAIRPKSGVKLLGAGQEKTRLVYRGTRPSVLVNFAGCEDAELADLTLDGEQSALVQQGVSGSDSRRLWLHHLTIRNLPKSRTWGPHAILFSGVNPTIERGVTDSRISDCWIENIGLGAEFGGGIRLAWGCVRNRIEGNVVRNTGRGGIFGDHSAELVIRDNRVSGSGGEGLGIEIWGGCPRSLIEDNVVDHWISNDNSNQSAIRRNTIGAADVSLKYLGIEVIARDCVVTNNVVKRGAHIGLSVSNRPVKNNVYWAYNTVSGCVQWGAQLQGDSGGIARHYFYRCVFENTVRGDPRARYPDSGHGFRTNGSCRDLVFDQCVIRNNGGLGVQLGGKGVDGIFFAGCTIAGNGAAALTQPVQYAAMELVDCRVEGNRSDRLPPQKAFPKPPPKADFRVPDVIRAGEPAGFHCLSVATAGTIAERLWDFDHGIPEVTPAPKHCFERPGKCRVTLVVWDDAGRGARAEKTVEVLPAQ